MSACRFSRSHYFPAPRACPHRCAATLTLSSFTYYRTGYSWGLGAWGRAAHRPGARVPPSSRTRRCLLALGSGRCPPAQAAGSRCALLGSTAGCARTSWKAPLSAGGYDSLAGFWFGRVIPDLLGAVPLLERSYSMLYIGWGTLFWVEVRTPLASSDYVGLGHL